MKRLSKIGLFAIALVATLLIGTSNVYADYNTSTGHSGGSSQSVNGCGTGTKYPILWITQNARNGDVISGFGYRYQPISKTLRDRDSDKRINQVSFLSVNHANARGYKWTHASLAGCKGPSYSTPILGTWVNWQYLSTMRQDAANGQTIKGYTSNYYLRKSYSLPDNMIEEIKKLNGKVVKSGYEDLLYYKADDADCSRNKYSTACEWFDLITDGEDLWQPQSRITEKTVLLEGECKNGQCTPFDYTSWSDEKLWREAPTSATYSYESKEGEYEYHHTLQYTLVTVRYHETWEEDPDGNRRNYKSWYSRGSEVTDTNTADWSATRPKLETKYFKPYDLYTEQQIDDSDKVFSGDRLKYLVDDPLKLVVDNHVNQNNNVSIDERYLDTLDDNGSLSWSLKFNNDQFGIPRASEGGIDIYKDHRSVGEVGLNKEQYYNPVFHINSSINNDNVTSLTFGGKEVPGTSELLQYYGNRGGEYSFKSIKTGSYKISSKEWSGFWSVKYDTSEYFNYGSRYSGRVTISGNRLVWSPTENSKIKVDITNKYLGEEKGSFVQPILRGGIRVRTVGGYKPN